MIDYNQKEEWRDVPGFEGYYVVSNNGMVKSIRKFLKRKGGLFESEFQRKISKRPDKYMSLTLAKDKVKTSHLLHRIVATCFVKNDNPEEKTQVNHINGNKGDNRSINLEWVSHSQNIRHAYRTGLNKSKRGEENPLSKITNAQARDIFKDERCARKIAEEYKISKTLVYDIKRGSARYELREAVNEPFEWELSP